MPGRTKKRKARNRRLNERDQIIADAKAEQERQEMIENYGANYEEITQSYEESIGQVPQRQRRSVELSIPNQEHSPRARFLDNGEFSRIVLIDSLGNPAIVISSPSTINGRFVSLDNSIEVSSNIGTFEASAFTNQNGQQVFNCDNGRIYISYNAAFPNQINYFDNVLQTGTSYSMSGGQLVSNNIGFSPNPNPATTLSPTQSSSPSPAPTGSLSPSLEPTTRQPVTPPPTTGRPVTPPSPAPSTEDTEPPTTGRPVTPPSPAPSTEDTESPTTEEPTASNPFPAPPTRQPTTFTAPTVSPTSQATIAALTAAPTALTRLLTTLSPTGIAGPSDNSEESEDNTALIAGVVIGVAAVVSLGAGLWYRRNARLTNQANIAAAQAGLPAANNTVEMVDNPAYVPPTNVDPESPYNVFRGAPGTDYAAPADATDASKAQTEAANQRRRIIAGDDGSPQYEAVDPAYVEATRAAAQGAAAAAAAIAEGDPDYALFLDQTPVDPQGRHTSLGGGDLDRNPLYEGKFPDETPAQANQRRMTAQAAGSPTHDDGPHYETTHSINARDPRGQGAATGDEVIYESGPPAEVVENPGYLYSKPELTPEQIEAKRQANERQAKIDARIAAGPPAVPLRSGQQRDDVSAAAKKPPTAPPPPPPRKPNATRVLGGRGPTGQSHT